MTNSLDLIRLEGIEKRYNKGKDNEKIALRDVNLTIKKGELIAITGKSGAGKTTLLNILGCLDSPTAGEYFFQDNRINELKADSLSEMRRKKLGIVMQEPLLIESLSAFENTILPTYLIKQSNKNRKIQAANMLKSVGIFELAEQRVSTMSGGERQRVAMARALVNTPVCVLADEPTGSLDNKNKAVILKILENISLLGKTVILVTHDMEIAKQCKRIITIDDGAIVEDYNATTL